MSTALLLRLVCGVLFGGVVTWSVWSRAERETDENLKEYDGALPRYGALFSGGSLPCVLVLLPLMIGLCGQWEEALSYLLEMIAGICLLIGVYDAVLLPLLPLLRRRYSARVCALLWLLPDCLYLLCSLDRFSADTDALVLHLPGKLAYVLLAVWAVGAAGVLLWTAAVHFVFRHRLLKNAVPVTDGETLAVWNAELEHAWISKTKWKLVRSDAAKTPLSIGLFARCTYVVLPQRSYSPEELSLVLRHEIIHLSRGDTGNKLFMTFCTAVCWFYPLTWVAMRKSADDFELSCDETVLLDAPLSVRRQYAQLLLNTAGDERGFTTCLSAKAEALRYRLKNVLAAGKKHTGAILIGVTVLILMLCGGRIRIAYDAQPGAQRIFDERALTDISVRYAVFSDDPVKDAVCADEAALVQYLARLQVENYTGAFGESDGKNLHLLFDTPSGTLSVTLYDQSLSVLRMWQTHLKTQKFYLTEPIDWQLLHTLLVPTPD